MIRLRRKTTGILGKVALCSADGRRVISPYSRVQLVIDPDASVLVRDKSGVEITATFKELEFLQVMLDTPRKDMQSNA